MINGNFLAALFLLALGLLYRNRANLGDGFPTDRTETEQVRKMAKHFINAYQEYPTQMFFAFGNGYVTRQILPFFTGTFAMNIMAGFMYGWLVGLFVCIFWSTFSAALAYAAHRIGMHLYFLKCEYIQVNNTSFLMVKSLFSLEMNCETKMGVSATFRVPRTAATWSELMAQTVALGTVRLLNLLPHWLVNFLLPLANFPFGPSVLSALMAAIPSCLFPVVKGTALDQIESINELYDHFVSYILFAVAGTMLCSGLITIIQKCKRASANTAAAITN